MYTINPTLRATRYGATYTYSHYEDGPCPDARYRCHKLVGTYCSISLIGPHMITDTSVPPKQASCHVSLLGEQFAMETSAGRWWHQGLDLQWAYEGILCDWT